MEVIDVANIIVRGAALAVMTALKVKEHSQGDIIIRTDGEPEYEVIVEYKGKEAYNSKTQFFDDSEEFQGAWREWLRRMNSMMIEIHGVPIDQLVAAGFCGQ